MNALADVAPEIVIAPAEYIRLLGYPPGWELRDRARDLADWARDWYAAHGRAWVYARPSESLELAGGRVVIDGVPFTSPRLYQTLQAAGANAAMLVAVSAGPELEAETQTLWQDGKPDEYFFLEVYGSAVVEHLVTTTGARLCAWADSRRLAVLPHYSPGYPDWAIAEQAELLRLVTRGGADRLDGPLDVMDSGMLRPKKSLLAVFGVTPHVDRVTRLTGLVPCENCSFTPCQYRRAPYRRAPMNADPELPAVAENAGDEPAPTGPLDRDATYATSVKALARWADERLTLETKPDGSIAATFRYDGTTCTNMGRPLAFDYHLTLSPAAEGFVIREQRCGPAPGDEGYTKMCRYLSTGEELMTTIAGEAPLAGRPLNDVLTWTRPVRSTGCYCDADGRQHKWGLVLETVHFALAREQRH